MISLPQIYLIMVAEIAIKKPFEAIRTAFCLRINSVTSAFLLFFWGFHRLLFDFTD